MSVTPEIFTLKWFIRTWVSIFSISLIWSSGTCRLVVEIYITFFTQNIVILNSHWNVLARIISSTKFDVLLVDLSCILRYFIRSCKHAHFRHDVYSNGRKYSQVLTLFNSKEPVSERRESFYSPCLWIWNSGALHWNRPHELIIWVSLKINNFRSLARSIHISTLPCPCSPYLEDSQRSKYPVLWLAISTKLKMRCNQGTREQEIFTAGVSWKSYCKHCYLCLRRTHGNWADICCSLWLGINIHFLPEFMTVSGGTNLFMLAEQGKVSLLRMFRVKDLS